MNTHDNLLGVAAKAALQPLGFRRRGRSRVWLRDHRWWLTVVEFQPHGSAKGSFLNVAAHWLWSEGGYLSFDFGGRVEEFRRYASDDQFTGVARQLAEQAAACARTMANTFPSVEAAADVLVGCEQSAPPRAKGSWATYHAGVAAGAAGRIEAATSLLGAITDPRVTAPAARLAHIANDPAAFADEVGKLIAHQRTALKLPALLLGDLQTPADR
ncbi:MAG: hypothetical protein JSR45_17660 [Proteobacteria bacterium]|nr:hypothetical protein [Pseudomonadota bacterium]